MINLIPGLPDNVVGFDATGIVTAEDYESVLIPAVEAKLAGKTKIRLLYHLGAEFEKYEWGAMWDDAKIGFAHLAAWERIAVVTDVGWVRSSVKMFGFAMPGEVKVFDNSELATAVDWLSE